MNDAELIRKLLDHAEAYGFREHSTHPSIKIYSVDIRGTVTHCLMTCSIMIDFHDVHAYHADGRHVTYCEGDAAVLQKHIDMNNNPSAVAEWAMKEYV